MSLEQKGQEAINEWITNITSDNWVRNKKAVSEWRRIAQMVGPEKTREELIKYLDGKHRLKIENFALLTTRW